MHAQASHRRQAHLGIAATALLALAPVLAAQSPAPSPVPTSQSPAAVNPAPGAASALRTEPPIEGFTRRSPDTLALRLTPLDGSPTELLLHDFFFNGDPVATTKLHLRQLAPGVVEVTSLAYSVGEWEFSVADAHSSFYGTGERFDTLNRAHTVVRNASVDNASAKGTSAYKPIPFFMSTAGYGLWLDTTADATFDFNVARPPEVQITVPSERLRIVLFTDPSFPHELAAFTKLTQRAVLPPYWAFAPWVGRDVHRSDAEVREDIDRTRALGLPASVLLIDSPWATAYNSYSLNPKQFADIPGMVKAVHAAAFKLVLWHTPWINSASDTPSEPGFADKIDRHSPNYDEAAAHGYFVKRPDGTPYVGHWWKGNGSLIDFTNPAAKLWWQDQLRQVLKVNGLEGADGFKDDDGEGSYQGDVVFADKTPRELMRNRYSVLYNNAVEEVIQKDLKGNGVLLARSVTTGANGLGFLWAGDNESSFSPENGLATVVTAGLNSGMSGMPLWTADLGGYLNSPSSSDPALLARWTEFAAFSPTMELLSQTNLQPWMWDAHAGTGGTQLLDLYRRYAMLHTTLFPYRYAAAQEAARSGMPILRALPLSYQMDAAARVAPAEYLFGPDLLVAPVVDANTRRPVYLPAGSWVNLWTGAGEAGGRTLLVDAPLDTIPVFARAGAVLPEIPEDVMTLVPAGQSGNQTVHGLDDRRVYEVVGEDGGRAEIEDFEGRRVVREGRSLTLDPSPVPGTSANLGEVRPHPDNGDPPPPKIAQVTVRWRFGGVRSATVNGASVAVRSEGGRSSVSFPLTGHTIVRW